MKFVSSLLTVTMLWLAGSSMVAAGWSDYLDLLMGSDDALQTETPASSLTESEMISALKQALGNGTQFAIDRLGREGGFLNNPAVKIPMPKSLSWVESTLRTLRQDRLADEFVATMNHAAERAVPEAASLFTTAISNMSVADAQAILTGPDDAATQYFRSSTETALTEKLRPIVEHATEKAGVTSAYKNMTAMAGGLTSLLSKDATDLDGYVTNRTLDGLFLMIAAEEKKIRENPMARGTDLLKKVFGAYSR